MAEFESEVPIYCAKCGEELTVENGRLASPEWYGETRFVHYCKKCQREQFTEFAYLISPYMAFYVCCAAYNIPFIPECVPEMGRVFDGFSWDVYLRNIDDADKSTRVDGEPCAFSDGVTDVEKLFGISVKTKINDEVTSEMLQSDSHGTKTQQKNWGVRADYSKEDYNELDRLYAIQSKSYEANGIDAEMEFNIREICKLLLVYSKQCAAGEIKEAKQTYDVISKMKADNLMRKKDEAPIAAAKIDTMMAALERNGYAKDGKLLPYDKLLQLIREDHPVYPMGKDIIDQILLAIWNAYRRNCALSETDTLPIEMQIDPKLGEFQEGSTDTEKKLIESLELPPMKYEKKEG